MKKKSLYESPKAEVFRSPVALNLFVEMSLDVVGDFDDLEAQDEWYDA